MIAFKNPQRRTEGFRDRYLRKTADRTFVAIVALLCVTLVSPSPSAAKRPLSETDATNRLGVLWAEPADIASRNLFYGPGGEDHEPHSTFTFLKEDLNGTNPKFDVRDENGTKWRVKLGAEARPETVASRLLWAVGYFANEDYYLPELRVEEMPRLKRGKKLIDPDGTMHNVRLKRFNKDEKKMGIWRWRDNPFVGTREFNGLRVMMAIFNNWDLKDENNAIYEKRHASGPALHYTVSDLGASFGTPGLSHPHDRSKGNLAAYSSSKFIAKLTEDSVDFTTPGRPELFHVNPKEFSQRLRLRWIGKNIPRADAKWIGQLLSRLSEDQVRQAFRAAGYSSEEVEKFTEAFEARVRELNGL